MSPSDIGKKNCKQNDSLSSAISHRMIAALAIVKKFTRVAFAGYIALHEIPKSMLEVSIVWN